MSEPSDYEHEEAIEHLYNQLGPQWAEENSLFPYEDAVRDFKTERLQSYYLKHPDMAGTAIGMLEEAISLRPVSQRAALLFAASAVEITIKHLLAKPMLNGLVHNEAVADVVMAMAPAQTGSDGFKNLLFSLLQKVADVDLAVYRRNGSNRALWDEWKQLQRDRNNLIHEGARPSSDTLATFDAVAVEFLSVIFPRVLRTLGLRVNGSLMIEG